MKTPIPRAKRAGVMHGVCVLCARSPLRKFPPRSPKFLGQAFFLSLTFILVLEWHRSYGSKWHCLVRRRRLRVGRDLAAVAAVEAVEAAGASFTAKPAAAERGDASVEAAVALLLLLGRGSLLLGWVVHRLAGRRVALVALIRGRVVALRGRGAVVRLLLVGHFEG